MGSSFQGSWNGMSPLAEDTMGVGWRGRACSPFGGKCPTAGGRGGAARSAALSPDEDGDARQYGGHGEPGGDGAHGVVVVGGLSHLHLVGLHVDDVVLLEVVDGRVEHVLRAEVDEVCLAHVAFLADDLHGVAAARDVEVARHAEGFEDSDVVAPCAINCSLACRAAIFC